MSEWTLELDGWVPADEPLREALCALGNGYLVTRGAAEEYAAGGAHYPGTYLAGGYDRPEGGDATEELVNWPNWLPITFRPDRDDGEWFDPERWTLLQYRRTLDLQRGLLVRRMRVRDPVGRVTSLRSRRLVHMGEPHLVAIEWELTPENWSGPLVIRSALDGTVENGAAEQHGGGTEEHLVPLAAHAREDGLLELLVEARQSGLRMGLAARHRISCDARDQVVARMPDVQEGYAAMDMRVTTGPGRTLCVEKVVAICTSRDRGIGEPLESAARMARSAPDFTELLRTHALAWRRLWRRGDVVVADAPEVQRALRLHAFHLLQTTSPHTADLDVGIPARGWHGEAFGGHVLWDELFAFPYVCLRFPDVARAVLLYRWRRLGEARENARALGLQGALFPWRSGSDGRRGRLPDEAHHEAHDGRPALQYHVNGAVARDVWRYYEATGDMEFMSAYGAEMVMETARFWASMAELDPADGRYHLRGVLGPDELHHAYPDADRPGVDDNAYTNVLASWTLRCAARALDLVPRDRAVELCDLMAVSDDERAHWAAVGSGLALHFHDGGILSQFAGYDRLVEPEWEEEAAEPGMDGPGARRPARDAIPDGETASHLRVAGHADVLMLFYLFTVEELTELLHHLGYELDADSAERTVRYYLERTVYRSALGEVVHAWMLARTDRVGSWRHVERLLAEGLETAGQHSAADGIHLGSMAATLDLMQRCYLGLKLRDGVLHLSPRVPDPLPALSTTVRHRGQWLTITATPDSVGVRCHEGLRPVTTVGVDGELVEVAIGEERRVELGVGGRRSEVGG
ncbi:MAG TPA: glycosyl hydrolase family 65 protein [Gemmatimonadales bacterium]